MKNKTSDYGYIDLLKSRKQKPYRLRLQINGKRNIYYFTNEGEALAFRDEARNLQNKVYRKGEVVHFSVLTLFRQWIEVKELSVSSGTIANFHNSFKHFYSLNNHWLANITKEDCLELIKNDPSKALKVCLVALNEMNKYSLEKYNYGFTWNIDTLIRSFKPRAKSARRVRSFYRADEIELILKFLKDRDLYWYHFFRIGFSLGARIGEICSLKKANYHRADKLLSIESTLHSVYRDGKTYTEDSETTKNGESRTIHLSESAIEAIEYFLKHSPKSLYLVPPKGKSKKLFITGGTVNSILKRVSKELGILYLPSHCAFRKTFATQVAKASKKSHRDMIAAIQKQLGHKSPQMALHYIQAIEVGLTDELEELDKILNKKGH